MTVLKSPLRSDSGFASPNFLVNNDGDVNAVNIVSNGNITVEGNLNTLGDISIVGNIISDGNFNVIDIVSESITVKGISLIDFQNDTYVLNNNITESNLENVGILKSLNVKGNINIKDSEEFVVVDITDGLVNLVSKSKGNLDNISIGLNTPVEAVFTDIEADDIKINNTPTELFHATRKDYVDTTAAALAIALGA
jgi:hypothetical protein